MLVRNYKGMARNKKHLVEAVSQRQLTRNSMLANKVDCEVLVRNYKVQQSISLRRSNMLAKNCKVVCEVVEAAIQRQSTMNSMLAKDREVGKNSMLARNSKMEPRNKLSGREGRESHVLVGSLELQYRRGHQGAVISP